MTTATITVNRVEVNLQDLAQILRQLGKFEVAKALSKLGLDTVLVPTTWDSIEECEVEIEGSVSKYIPANFNGHPDNWYPEEGGEVEVHEVTCEDFDVVLTDAEMEQAADALEKAAKDCDY